MTASLMAQGAYGAAAARPLRTARGTEAETFAEFTDAHSRAVLRGADAAPLLEINRAVMAGLRPTASEAAA